MYADGIILCNSSAGQIWSYGAPPVGGTFPVGSSVSNSFMWRGGRSVAVINSLAYGGGVFFQMQGPSGAWINLNSTTITADCMIQLDMPACQVRIINNQSSSPGIYAMIARVPY